MNSASIDDVSPEEIKDTFSLFTDWEDKYRYIIDLGKELPELDEKDKIEKNLIRGCQSQVWLTHNINPEGSIHLDIDSDAHIVRGLIAIVLAALNDKLPRQIIEFDVELLFSDLELLEHLSPTRGNGLRAMVQRVQSVAESSI
ncbi:MAG: Fe-S cluster assembly protein SufE [Proteobacteria bacterium TMED261]|mgnify:FL=1|nr:MAG: Fe-S cluster assembly protein SufE [Proteobacteria bacterium TMED261]